MDAITFVRGAQLVRVESLREKFETLDGILLTEFRSRKFGRRSRLIFSVGSTLGLISTAFASNVQIMSTVVVGRGKTGGEKTGEQEVVVYSSEQQRAFCVVAQLKRVSAKRTRLDFVIKASCYGASRFRSEV